MSISLFRGFGLIRRTIRATLGLGPIVAMVVGTQPAYAAPPANNIVSACSGVSLPRSVVTDILRPVITGVTAPTEASVNGLLGVVDGLVLGPLLGVPTLNTNASGLLDTAAAGQPITLKAISNSGTVLGPSDPCYSQATGYTLATPAGIAVGGNQISGLGSGTVATSGELNSIAFGNGAITNASALGSIAFGTNAQVGANAVGGMALGRNSQVTAAGSVALGDGSVASRGALTNYTATGLSALQSSAGEVSVGASGAARQITNVAAGSSATDAVNVAQLQGVSGAVTTLDNVAIKYNDGTRATATLGGAGGTTITNLKAGAVTGSSTDAVNGSQLFATNANVTANSTATTNLRNDVTNGAIGALRYANAGTPTTPNGGTPSQDVTIVGGAAGAVKVHNVGDATIAAGSTDAVNGGQLYNLTGQVNLLAGLGVQYDDGTKAKVTLGGAGTGAPAVTIANVKAGTLGATSTEAVNGSQLFSTNANVTTNATAITNLRNQTTNGSIGTVQFSSSIAPTTPNGGIPSQDMTLVGGAAGAVKLHNVANGTVATGSTDAINGGQLFAVSGQVDLLSGLAVKYDDGTQTHVTLGTVGVPVGISNVANGALNAGSTAAVNGSQLFATNTTINNLSAGVNNGSVGPVRYSNVGTPTIANGGTITNDVTMVGAAPGAVRIHNVADGNVAAGSTDGINGGQLYTLQTSVTALGGLSVQYVDGTKTSVALGNVGTPVSITNVAAGTLSAGSTSAVNGSQLFTTNQNVTNNATAITNLSTNVNNGSVGLLRYSNTGTPTTPNGGIATNDVTIVGGSAGAVRLHNVANGNVAAGSTDGVNGGQLFALQGSVGTLDGLAVKYDDSTKSHVTLGSVGTPVGVSNVANGALNALSSDAVNGSQLFATNQTINSLSTSVTNGSVGPVRYSNILTPTTPNGGTVTNDVTMVGALPGAVRIHNVADGTVAAGSTDGVNGGQLFTVQNSISTLNGLSVQYDSSAKNHVTLGNLGTPVTISNVSNGALNALSSDAVNGSQLFTTNQNVTNNATAITNLTNNVNNGAVGLLRYSNTGTPAVPNGGIATNDVTIVGGAAGAVRIHNVADGTVAAGSTDGVNGGQLYTLQSSIAAVGGNAVQYDDLTKTRVTLGGLAGLPVTVANVANGAVTATSAEAVNGSQLFGLGQTLTTSINNSNAFSLALSNSVSNGGVGPVQYSNAGTPTTPNGGTRTQDLTLVGNAPGAVGLHNVAAGLICNCSTDAINGSQFFGVANNIASVLGLTYNSVTNSYGGNFSFGSDQYTSVQNVFAAIYDQMTAGGSTSNTASKYFHTTSLLADSTASGADATAIGPNAIASGDAAIATGRDAVASGDGAVAIGNGATAQDGKAVSIGFGNIASGNGAVSIGDPNTATGEGAVAMGKDNTADGDGAIALGNTNSATGLGSAAIGYFNTTNGLASVAIGNENIASGDSAFAVGHRNQAIGDGALAIGDENMALGDGSLAIGRDVWNSAADTIAMGNNTQVTNIDSIAIGNRSVVNGESATAVGNDTIANGLSSAAFGDLATATGDYATALGSSSIASGVYALAVGQGATSTNGGSISLGNFSQALAYGGTALGTGASAVHEDSTALGNAATTTRGAVSNYSAFGLSGLQNSLGELAIARNISYLDDRTGLMTAIGERQITGVAAGSAATDAVNVSQLQGVSSNLGMAIASSMGGGMTYNTSTGQLSMPSFLLNGTTYNNVGDALAAISAGGSGGSGGSGSSNSPIYDDSTHTSVTLTGTGGTSIHNVAAGDVSTTSTDAVNGSQLAATNQQVTNLSNRVENGAVGTVQYSDASSPSTPNGGTKTNDVTLVGAQQAPVALHNVAAGRVAAGSTDAVNGDQLAATNDAVSMAQAAASRAVQYDGDTQTSVTLGSGGDTPVALHNVAEGVSGTDAVNVSQLDAGMTNAVTQANAYTDSRIAALSFDLRKISRDSNAGTAGALAAAGLPQTMEGGRGMLAMAAGTFQGQHAMAIGFSKASDNGRTIVKAGATYNSRGQLGANVGIGFQM